MISPLTYRQVLQTATVEAVRYSAEGAQQVAREEARRQALELKQKEEADEVHDVAEVSVLALGEDRQPKGGKQPREGHEEASAEDAENHLDMMA